MNTTEQVQETWHVEANGEVFETNFAELTTWIDEGSLLRIDRVRKENLRWIEAGKVPALLAVFNAKDNGQPLPTPVVTTTKLEPSTFAPLSHSTNPAAPADPMCAMHEDVAATYTCETCLNHFCKACPNSYGGSVKICPFCGAMCMSFEAVEQARVAAFEVEPGARGSFGFSDLGEALAYPFKFKASLIAGGIMFMIFSIGQGAGGMGSMFLAGASIFCYMATNMLSFGVLANTVDNFSQGKIGLNFMPSFDDFSLWDDVVHPFFLSIGVYIASFGPLIAVLLIAFFVVFGSVSKELNGVESDAARVINPQLPYTANAARQTEEVRNLLNKTSDKQEERIAAIENSTALEEDNEEAFKPPTAAEEEAEFARLNQMIQDSRKAQLESAIGKTPETVASEKSAMLSQILGYGLLFLALAGVSLIWGLFYFPAASIVAAYTRSFVATLDPAVGLDTIRRLGVDYVKILLMGFVIVLISGTVAMLLAAVFSPFDMPAVGNLPATAIGSFFGFYFSVVFSCVIGFALYKAADRLKLYR